MFASVCNFPCRTTVRWDEPTADFDGFASCGHCLTGHMNSSGEKMFIIFLYNFVYTKSVIFCLISFYTLQVFMFVL